MFTFENLTVSGDGKALSATCAVAPEQAFFAGHFPGAPVMPAVAQLQMVQALLKSRSDWPDALCGGSTIKFLRRVGPGAVLQIRLARGAAGTIRFSLEQDGDVVARGSLQAAGDGVD